MEYIFRFKNNIYEFISLFILKLFKMQTSTPKVSEVKDVTRI
jgi:hypothetical protein